MKPVMLKLITHTSLLKGYDCRLTKEPFGSRMCILCDLYCLEDTDHMIMQCPIHENTSISMYNEINEKYSLALGGCTLANNLLGRKLINKSYAEMLPLWCIASHHIYMMYKTTINCQKGIG